MPPVVVAGSGIAGLCAALSAAPRKVLLLGRSTAGADTASRLAQGGIAAALGAGDSIAAHIEDTLICGARVNHAGAVAYLCRQAPAAIAWLQQMGVVFDGDGHGMHLAREGGHRCARVAHVGGDASGAGLLRALQAVVRQAAHIQWRESLAVESLLLEGERVAGVSLCDRDHYRFRQPAAAVVLATGGIGGLFAATSNPASSQGYGLALAQAVGAALRDLEFIQFHPTALAATDATVEPQRPLITEALRGAGAVLRDQSGRAVMAGVHPLADLAPRDRVSRHLWQLQQAGRQLFLDARELGIDWPRQFPTVLGACLAAGIDPREQPISVTPAAHFHMGGIACDLDGATTVPGLYAVGEVAGNGVHGGNRLASNALLEGVVFGRRLGQMLAQGLEAVGAMPSGLAVPMPASASTGDLANLRQTLWQALGPVRTAHGLAQARARLGNHATLAQSWQGVLAQRLLAAARSRRESCGAHWRADTVVPVPADA